MKWHFDERTNVTVLMVLDTLGQTFDPTSCSHVYTYNIDNTLATDLATDPLTGIVRLKTYNYTSGNMTSETAWVVQS